MSRAAALAACAFLAACGSTGRSAPPPAPPAPGFLDVAAAEALAGRFAPSTADPQEEPWLRAEFAPGGDRWWMAIAHAELRPPHAAQHFDCVLGARMTARPRPALTRLMARLTTDGDTMTRRLAQAHPRRRPVADDPTLQPCQRLNDATRDSPSWPAGGAVAAAAYAEMFAHMAPERAEALRRRGAEIGFSRAVCRMNRMAEVRDGLAVGRAVYDAAVRDPDFAAAFAAARAEVEAARAEGLANPGCAAERLSLEDLRPGGG